MSTLVRDLGVGSPASNEAWGDREDHAPYSIKPLQESIDSTGSPSRLVAGPPSSPLTPRFYSQSGQARSDATTEHSPQQPLPTVTNEPISSQSRTEENIHPCSTPGAINLQLIIENSELRDTQVVVAGVLTSNDSSQGNKRLVETDGQVARYSIEFGRVTDEIVTAVKEEKKDGLLLRIAYQVTGTDSGDFLFPGAAEASTIEEFFRLGSKNNWWHWIDFDRLILILEELENDCPRALRIIQQYMKRLSDCAMERLSVLGEAHPRDEGHWIEMKCQCDHANLTVKTIEKHKEFLIKYLKVPPLSFTFRHTYKGCMVTVWRVHSGVQFAEAKKKFLSIGGCSKTEEPGRETFKVTLFTPFSDLCAHVMQGTLDVDSLTEAQLCAVNESFHTLLSLAVECDQPGIVEKLLVKGLSQKVKDFKATEMKQTALNIAAHKDYCACLKALIMHGCHPAVPDVAKKVALQYACSNDCVTCVTQICEAPGTASLTRLDWARRFLVKPCFSEALVQAIGKAQTRRQCEVVAPALFEAARTGEFLPAIDILEEGDDLNVKSKHGEWPLYVAAQHGHLQLMKTLEEYACSVQVVGLTNDGNTILHAAVLSRETEVVEYALQHMAKECGSSLLGLDVNARNDKGMSALELATLSGNPGMVELLLNNGAHPCVPSSRGELLTSPYEAIQHVLVQHRKTHWLKIYTAMGGKKSPLQQFIRVWQDPYDHNLRSSYGDNMLMIAAREGKSDAVKFLLDSLKNISKDGVLTRWPLALPQGDAFPGSFYQEHTDAEAKGDAKASSPVLSKYLLMVNPYDGFTAAHCAAASGRVKCLTNILECNPTCLGIQNEEGNTLLHIAATGHHTSCIKKIMELASPADVSTLNKKGQYADELLNQRVYFWTLRGKLQAQRRKHSKNLAASCNVDFRAEKCAASDDMAIDPGESCEPPASNFGRWDTQ